MKKNGEKIPFSNYIKLFFIVLLTLICVFVVRNIYVSNINYEKKIPVIRDTVVSEINSSEIYNYIRENEDTIIYIGVADNENCRNLEEKFNEIIRNNNLGDRITYLNLSNEKKKQTFIKEFNKFYNTKLLGIPSLIIFKEGKVSDILTVKTGNALTISEVSKFLEKNNIMSENYD